MSCRFYHNEKNYRWFIGIGVLSLEEWLGNGNGCMEVLQTSVLSLIYAMRWGSGQDHERIGFPPGCSLNFHFLCGVCVGPCLLSRESMIFIFMFSSVNNERIIKLFNFTETSFQKTEESQHGFLFLCLLSSFRIVFV